MAGTLGVLVLLAGFAWSLTYPTPSGFLFFLAGAIGVALVAYQIKVDEEHKALKDKISELENNR